MSVLPTIIRGQWPARAIPRVRRSGRGAHRQRPVVMGNERVLARTQSPDGVVLGSDRALYIAGAPRVWRRIDWADIASVERSDAGLVMRLWPADDPICDEVRVRTDAVFAVFAAERVAATQVLRRRVPIRAGVAIVTAVRVPGKEDTVWRVQLDSRCDRNDAEVGLAVQRVIAELRALTGC